MTFVIDLNDLWQLEARGQVYFYYEAIYLLLA